MTTTSPPTTTAIAARAVGATKIYGEGETEDAAISDLKEAVRGYIETFGLEETISRVAAASLSRGC